jgi:YbbR domain-containing protein
MSLRESIRHNLGLKVFALFLAVLTWLTLRYMERNARWPSSGITSTAPVELTGVPIRVLTESKQPAACQLEPDRATVVLRGRGADLSKLTEREVWLFVNLVAEKESVGGTHLIQAHCPPGVTVEQIKPPVAIVRLAPQDASGVGQP